MMRHHTKIRAAGEFSFQSCSLIFQTSKDMPSEDQEVTASGKFTIGSTNSQESDTTISSLASTVFDDQVEQERVPDVYCLVS